MPAQLEALLRSKYSSLRPQIPFTRLLTSLYLILRPEASLEEVDTPSHTASVL